MSITRGLETLGNTRFMTAYRCLRSVQRNLPALQHCIRNGIISLKNAKVQCEGSSSGSGSGSGHANLAIYLDDSPTSKQFRAHLNFAVHALQPLAWALKLIEAPATTTADIFIHWLAIGNNYLEKFQEPDSPWVQQYPEECQQIIIRFNLQFKKGLLNEGNCLYAVAFFLHPQFHAHSILRGSNDAVINQIGSRLFQAFTEMSQRCDDPSTGSHSVSMALCKRFFIQLAQYKHHDPPFDVPYHPAAQETPRRWWEKLLHIKGQAVKELAEVAIMLFSVKPTSLPEERCGSIIDWLMPGRRNRLKPSTLIQMIKLRNFYLYTHYGQRQLKVFTISHADVTRDVLPNTLQFDGAIAHRPQQPGHQPSESVSHGSCVSHDPVERMLPPTRTRTVEEADCIIADAAACAELRHPVVAGLAAQMARHTDPTLTTDDRTSAPELSRIDENEARMIDVGKLNFSQFGMPV
jgi:hypothetical protein